MSDRAQAWVWDHSRSKGTDKLILLKFADEADHWGDNSIVGLDTMSETTGVVRSTVREAIKRLGTLGELEIQQEAKGRGHPATYRLPKVPKRKSATKVDAGKGTDSDTFSRDGKVPDSDTFSEGKGAERCGKGTDSDTFSKTTPSYKDLKSLELTISARECDQPPPNIASQEAKPNPPAGNGNRDRATSKAPSVARLIPDNWEPPPDELIRMAVDCPLVDLGYETAQIVDWAKAKGEKRADWVATWRSCLRRAQKRAAEGVPRQNGSSNGNGYPQVALGNLPSMDEINAAAERALITGNGWLP